MTAAKVPGISEEKEHLRKKRGDEKKRTAWISETLGLGTEDTPEYATLLICL